MDALMQYIDLYKAHSGLVNSNSEEIMNQPRERALEILESSSLPHKGEENYETIDLPAILAPDYGLNLARIEIDVNASAPFRCGVPNVSSSLFIVRNDLYSESKATRDSLPEGVYAGSLKEFCRVHPEIASQYYSKIANLLNPLVALNTLYAQDGIVVWVKQGVKLEKPLQIVNVLQNGMPLMAVRRLLFIMEENAEVKVLMCDHTQTDNVDFVALQTTEVFLAPNASLDIYELEESTRRTSRLSQVYACQQEGSHLLLDGITLFNGVTRNEYYVNLAGRDASLHLFGMAIEDKDRQIDTYSRVEHNAKGCHTDELLKYVIDDEAVGAFAGLIRVAEGADKTEAFQSNRNILGSDSAKVFSKPQLEIYDDDVKCSHGSATGQLDELQVFYMRTRGIPEEQAKFLLKQAFMADVIDAVKLPSLRDRLRLLVEKRFSGELYNCLSCSSGCHDLA